jgi:hypothetical protein
MSTTDDLDMLYSDDHDMTVEDKIFTSSSLLFFYIYIIIIMGQDFRDKIKEDLHLHTLRFLYEPILINQT